MEMRGENADSFMHHARLFKDRLKPLEMQKLSLKDTNNSIESTFQKSRQARKYWQADDRTAFWLLWSWRVVKWSNYSWECINAWIWDDWLCIQCVDVIKLNTYWDSGTGPKPNENWAEFLKQKQGNPRMHCSSSRKGRPKWRNVDYANITALWGSTLRCASPSLFCTSVFWAQLY